MWSPPCDQKNPTVIECFKDRLFGKIGLNWHLFGARKVSPEKVQLILPKIYIFRFRVTYLALIV